MTDFPAHLFKSYDIRGIVDQDLTDHLVAHIGAGVAEVCSAKTVVIGEDIRESSKRFADVLSLSMRTSGCTVIRLGLCGTEEVYHATVAQNADAGLMVTASHNPIDYNGIKIVRKGAKPFRPAEDMTALKSYVEKRFDRQPNLEIASEEILLQDKSDYVQKMLSFVDFPHMKLLKIVVNSGNGASGPTLDALAEHLPFELIRIHHTPDGTFPNGIPNPILVENREATAKAVRVHGADFGVAWDGDFDRCFLFDDQGNFISNYYLLGLLSKTMLNQEKGGTIVQDVRQLWDTSDIINKAGGRGIFSQVGHGYYKQKMREENAIMGGEISGHFYFRDFHFCDSGMIPWLLVAQMLSQSGESLSSLVGERQRQFPSSEEINQPLSGKTAETLEKIKAHYTAQSGQIETLDGVSVTFDDWRFNVRPSSNEPLLRLNLEAKTEDMVTQKLDEVQNLIETL